MMRFPSQIPCSRTTKVTRVAVALAALAVLAASIFGLSHALKPVPDETPDAWHAPTGFRAGDSAGDSPIPALSAR